MSYFKVNWKYQPNLQGWKLVAEEKQKFYYEYVGKRKWEQYKLDDLHYLKLKICYALFGPPLDAEGEDFKRFYEKPNQKQKIDYIMHKIQKINIDQTINIGIVYFIAAIEGKYSEFPIIRVFRKREKKRDICYFIDPIGYCYSSFERFLNTNIMPSCIYCYPKNGFYTLNDDDQLELEYSFSPGHSIVRKLINLFSETESGDPPNSAVIQKDKPFAINKVVIKGVFNEAKNQWIEIKSVNSCSSLLAVHSMYSIAKYSQKCEIITNLMAKIFKKGQMKTNWYTVLNMLPEILRYTNEVNHIHTAQLFAAFLFFCHTIVSYKTIKELLRETLKDFSDGTIVSLNQKHIETLQKTKQRFFKKHNEEVISVLKRINDRDKLEEEILATKENENIDENENLVSNLLDVLKGVMNNDNIINDYISSPCP